MIYMLMQKRLKKSTFTFTTGFCSKGTVEQHPSLLKPAMLGETYHPEYHLTVVFLHLIPNEALLIINKALVSTLLRDRPVLTHKCLIQVILRHHSTNHHQYTYTPIPVEETLLNTRMWTGTVVYHRVHLLAVGGAQQCPRVR